LVYALQRVKKWESGSLFLVIPDIVYRESILIAVIPATFAILGSFLMDPRLQLAGMTKEWDGYPPLPMTTGASSETAGMTLGVLSVLTEISIVSDSVLQMNSRFLRLNLFSLVN
jgi:hypothetical protein